VAHEQDLLVSSFPATLERPAIGLQPRSANEAWDESRYRVEVSHNPEPRFADRSWVRQRRWCSAGAWDVAREGASRGPRAHSRTGSHAMPGAARGGGACRLFTDQSEITRHSRSTSGGCRSACSWHRRARQTVPLLGLRADPDEREALLSSCRPLFAPRTGRDRVGATHQRTDWEEIHELVTRAIGSARRRSPSHSSTSERWPSSPQ
jgi:hypothetical protein